ncbi:ROK family transcriptional regulator [Bacillus sp. Marseille-P3661]|uniref:ROK family transcriptional regulator n=1 Tax=Bacillus sp. Marseille-P3661 TaxID=1936234 RepID=UPI000C817D03|nr:ROK family transcriptional regulator [Bacillus sp. Marseille-P3661]
MLKNFLQDHSVQNQPLREIYKYIYENAPVSRADIIKKTELNRTKVAHLLEELLRMGFISHFGYGEPTGGRPPVLYKINSECSYIIGVQINRIHTRVILFDLLFNTVEEETVAMTYYHTPDVIIPKIIDIIESFKNTFNFSLDELVGIGIGTVGPLDRNKGIILNPNPPIAKDWVNVALVDEIKKKFPVKVILENGANAIALGEFKEIGSPIQNLLNVTVGWSWGCGVIVDGNLLEVKSGDVSGYSHMILEVDGKDCSCGKKGCANAYTSVHALLNDIKLKAPSLYDEYIKNIDQMTFDEVMRFLLLKESVVEDSVISSARYLGIAVANMVNMFHSEVVILNGPLIDYYPNYFEEVTHHAMLNLYHKEKITMKKAKFESESALKGNAVQVFDLFLE